MLSGSGSLDLVQGVTSPRGGATFGTSPSLRPPAYHRGSIRATTQVGEEMYLKGASDRIRFCRSYDIDK